MEINIAGQVAQQEGFVYAYLTNESNAEVYFDDFEVTIKESLVVQSNDYYPFGLQHSTSWTRPTDLKNNFLYNAGSELNEKTKNYEMFYRDYDAALGRMTAIDPMAIKYASLSPYNYAFNDPVALNDPMGDDPAGAMTGSYVNRRTATPGDGNSQFVWDASEQYGFWHNHGQVSSSNNFSHVSRQPGGGLINWSHSQSTSTGNFFNFALDLFSASRDGITHFSGNDVRTTYNQWSSLGKGEGFALNYGIDGSLSFDTYRFTAGGNGGSNSTKLNSSNFLLDMGNGLFHYGDDKGALKIMRSLSESLGIEISALLLEGDLVYIFPWENNTYTESYNITWFKIVLGKLRGSLGVIPWTFADIPGRPRVLAQVHTHPDDVKLSSYNDKRNRGDLTLSASWQVPVFVLGPRHSFYGQYFGEGKSFNKYFAKTSDILNGTYSIREKARQILNRFFPH